MKPDFSGYATKSNLRCSDGLTIMPGAFKSNEGAKVPLVWQHGHSDATNILGHALLTNRPDGVWADCFFNDSDTGNHAKTMVSHGDIQHMSIFANNLIKQGANVVHGAIREVSLVISGANPGALIDPVSIRHSDGSVDTLEDEAIIYTGELLEHAEKDSKENTVADTKTTTKVEDRTVQDVYDEFTQEQKDVVAFMIGAALEDQGNDDDDEGDDSVAQFDTSDFLTHEEGFKMINNVFEMNAVGSVDQTATLSHSQLEEVVTSFKRFGSAKESFLAHAAEYGIENIDMLFPDFKTVTATPEFISRRTEWVANVLANVHKSPFSRIKTVFADITEDEARAKGYITGNRKKEEVFKLLKRTTEPTTIYKKQKFDRDDLLDITDLNVIVWIKAEMRLMLDEELATAILIGDSRSESDEDKINEDKIRPIASDDNLYAHQAVVNTNQTIQDQIKSAVRARGQYKGSGNPTFYTTQGWVTDALMIEDKIGRAIYADRAALANKLQAKEIVEVETMERTPEIIGIYVNLRDYTLGSDKGGEINMFDDFDIDYNQQKYLLETRVSGTLVRPKAAIVLRRSAGSQAFPVSPSFNAASNELTFVAVPGITYLVDDGTITEVTTATTVSITADAQVDAVANDGYYIAPGSTTTWQFTFTGA